MRSGQLYWTQKKKIYIGGIKIYLKFCLFIVGQKHPLQLRVKLIELPISIIKFLDNIFKMLSSTTLV